MQVRINIIIALVDTIIVVDVHLRSSTAKCPLILLLPTYLLLELALLPFSVLVIQELFGGWREDDVAFAVAFENHVLVIRIR